ELPELAFPDPVMSFAVTPKAKGDEDKMAQGLRRLAEEARTIQPPRDPQTGEQLLSGLSQMHVEVPGDRLSNRFHVDAQPHPSSPRGGRSRSPARWRSAPPTRRPSRCCSSRSWRSRSSSPTKRSGPSTATSTRVAAACRGWSRAAG